VGIAFHCVFALPQCHYNLYKHSFVLRNLFVSDIVFFVCFLVLNSLFMLCYAFSLLMAFDRLLLKGLLTYLLTYIVSSLHSRPKFFITSMRPSTNWYTVLPFQIERPSHGRVHGRLGWLPFSFLLHVLSYRIVGLDGNLTVNHRRQRRFADAAAGHDGSARRRQYMAPSRRRYFGDVYIFVYSFLEFVNAVDNFSVQCKHRQIVNMLSNEPTCFYINYMLCY